jgi:hypothetical protein
VCASRLHFSKGVVNLHRAPVSSPLTFLHRAIGNWTRFINYFVTTAAVPAPTSHCDNISSREENCVHRVLAAAVPQRWQVCCHVCVSVKYHCVNGNMRTFFFTFVCQRWMLLIGRSVDSTTKKNCLPTKRDVICFNVNALNKLLRDFCLCCVLPHSKKKYLKYFRGEVNYPLPKLRSSPFYPTGTNRPTADYRCRCVCV